MESKLEVFCGNEKCKAQHTLTEVDFLSVVKRDQEATEHNKQAEEDYNRDMEEFKVREIDIKDQYKRLYKGITYTVTQRVGLLKRKREDIFERYVLSDYSKHTYIYDQKEKTYIHDSRAPHKTSKKNELYIVCPFCGTKSYLQFNRGRGNKNV